MKTKTSGRPKKTVIDTLRTLIWYEYVAEQVLESYIERSINISINEINSAKASLKHLGDFFDQEDSNAWYKYSIGLISPNNTSLELVDNKIPFASTYFKHPIWNFLKTLPTGKLDLDIFYNKLSPETRSLLETEKITCKFNFSYTDTYDFLEFNNNVLEFYSCILFQYYQAKFRLKNKDIMSIFSYFWRNTDLIIYQSGASGYYLLKLMYLHLVQPDDTILSDLTVESNLEKLGLLPIILKELQANKKRYELLEERFNAFRLDGDQYTNSHIYIFLDGADTLVWPLKK